MKQIKGNKGFGLVECVVAMFLICVVLLGMAGHIGVTMAAMQTDKSTSVASSLLQDKVGGDQADTLQQYRRRRGFDRERRGLLHEELDCDDERQHEDRCPLDHVERPHDQHIRCGDVVGLCGYNIRYNRIITFSRHQVGFK